MGITDGMKSITEGIIASHEARVRGARERRDEVNELVDNARKTVRHFATDRKHMGEGQAKALAEYVETLRADVGGMIKGFQKDHAAVAAGIREKAEALRETLASGEADRMKSFKGMMTDTRQVIKGIEKSVKDIKTYVAGKMSEFNDERAEMGQELRKDLSKYVADIAKDTKAVLGSAREMVDGFAKERTEMSSEWRGMVNSLAKSAGVEPKIKPAKQATTVESDEAPVEKKSKKRGRKKRGKKNR